MNALKLENDTVAAVHAYLRQEHKGWVKNRLSGDPYNNVHSQKHKFAVIVPNFHDDKITLKGSFTYGRSGFTFRLTTNLNGDNKPILDITRHSECEYNDNDIHAIVMKLVFTAKKKITGTEENIYGELIEPTLKACKKTNKKINPSNKEKILHFEQKGFFDSAFKSFLLEHEIDGIRCCKSRKK